MDRPHEVMILSARDSLAFVEAILTPSEPSERLRRAAKRYREFSDESPWASEAPTDEVDGGR